MIGNFNDRVKEIHHHLDAARIGHAFGGAIALIYAVFDPRLTHDIDLNIAVPVGESERVFAALPESLPWSADDVETVSREGQVRLRWAPELPVDLFFPQHRFHDVVAARVRTVTFDGEPLPVISPTDLAVFKAMFSRAKDWADIEAMLEAGSVDRDEALRWTEVILGADHPSHEKLADLCQRVRPRPPGGGGGDPNIWKGR